VTTALRQKQFEKAIPWARRRVELAKSVTDLEGATTQVVTACQQCDRVEAADFRAETSRQPIDLLDLPAG